VVAELKPDKVFPHFITNNLPAGVVGIILVGLVAASMSTLSSELNSFGAVVASDIYARVTHADAEAARLRISRYVVMAFGLAAILLALWISGHEGGIFVLMVDIFNWMGATFGGGMLAMFLLGFFSPRTHRKGMYPALVIGLVFALWCAATSQGWIVLPDAIAFLGYRWHEWWLIALSTGLIAGCAYVFSRILAPGERAPEELTAYAKHDGA
jgi:Na+/proline symporter